MQASDAGRLILIIRNVSAKVSCGTAISQRDTSTAGPCRPRFSFFSMQLSKNRHLIRNVEDPNHLKGNSAIQDQLALFSLILFNAATPIDPVKLTKLRSALGGRLRRTALVDDRLISPTKRPSQHAFHKKCKSTHAPATDA